MEQVAVIHTAFEDKPSTVAFVEYLMMQKHLLINLSLHIGGHRISWMSWSLKDA